MGSPKTRPLSVQVARARNEGVRRGQYCIKHSVFGSGERPCLRVGVRRDRGCASKLERVQQQIDGPARWSRMGYYVQRTGQAQQQ